MPAARSHLKAMATRTESFAAMSVISIIVLITLSKGTGLTMTPEQFKREAAYRATLSIAKSMLQKGLINENEYKKIDTIMFEKYHPLLGGLYR